MVCTKLGGLLVQRPGRLLLEHLARCLFGVGPRHLLHRDVVARDATFEDVKKHCASDPAELASKLRQIEDLANNKRGVGISTYVTVPDIDAWHATVTKQGVKTNGVPKTQFYGIREVQLEDPDGYSFMFYSPVKLANCQSCSMPMTDAEPGAMYCAYCVDEQGKLKSYETILEGCISGYFIPMQKMSRPDAEKAAREMLKQQPAWALHK